MTAKSDTQALKEKYHKSRMYKRHGIPCLFLLLDCDEMTMAWLILRKMRRIPLNQTLNQKDVCPTIQKTIHKGDSYMTNNRPGGRQRQVTGTGSGVKKTGSGLGTGKVGTGVNRPGSGTSSPRPSSGSSFGSSSQRPSSRPSSRPRTPVGQAGGVFHGGSYGNGPVGQGSRPGGTGRTGSTGTGGGRRSGCGSPVLIVVVLLLVFVFGGRNFLSGGTPSDNGNNLTAVTQQATRTAAPTARPTATARATARPTAKPAATQAAQPARTRNPNSWYSQLLSGQTAAQVDTNTTQMSTTSSGQIRERYTKLLGSGQDTVTLMVYICGTDLESRSGMASSDLQEMARASFGDNVRIIVYTGGCSSWRISNISSSRNQIWRLADGKLSCLKEDDGSASMTNPSTLSRFIRFCAENYPASRYNLILWDHGGGSVSGYGYDEKNRSSGSMSLSGLNTALKDGGVKFDFIGFDACLMATVETALMCGNYADYMIASEETEPGIGWYYTDWLTSLGKNTSIATTTLGKQICDDFVSACNQRARGQTTTLSVVDLAEVQARIPAALSGFARSVSGLIENKSYSTVSNARNGSREFARSSKIDQVDLADLANRMGTQEGRELASVIQSCVKYNKANGITNAYGLSIYFPYQKISNVDKAVATYEQIGMDDAYSDCIRAFASLEASGQLASGGSHNPMSSLLGSGYSSYSSQGYGTEELLSELLGSFFGSTSQSTSGSSSSYSSSSPYSSFGTLGFLFGRNMSQEDMASYIYENRIDGENLIFRGSGNDMILSLPEEQWDLVHGLDLNIFVDDGQGYMDLGLDNVFSFDESGNLVADTSGIWLSISGQIVPYYHLDTEASGRVTGYIPALLNGQTRVNLYVAFEGEGYGKIVGVQTDYLTGGETETSAKVEETLQVGDTLQFLCDYYAYDGTYTDTYYFGDPVTVTEDMQVTDAYLPDGLKLSITYRLTDIYNQTWWTNAITVRT